MAEKMRYNKIIDLLEHGKPVFSTSTVPNGSLDDLTYIADADYDAVIIEMEHEGFSFTTLRTSLQVLLNRKRIAEKGNLQPDVVPMVRIPPNARERNQWVIKQALDTGVYGLVLPHLSTVEDAQAAVAAARYPQVPGVQDFAPAGERGWGNRIASRYWGLTPQEYYDAADLWPLDPEGNILLMGIVDEDNDIAAGPLCRALSGYGNCRSNSRRSTRMAGRKGVGLAPAVSDCIDDTFVEPPRETMPPGIVRLDLRPWRSMKQSQIAVLVGGFIRQVSHPSTRSGTVLATPSLA